jgi:hypothetical protein
LEHASAKDSPVTYCWSDTTVHMILVQNPSAIKILLKDNSLTLIMTSLGTYLYNFLTYGTKLELYEGYFSSSVQDNMERFMIDYIKLFKNLYNYIFS